ALAFDDWFLGADDRLLAPVPRNLNAQPLCLKRHGPLRFSSRNTGAQSSVRRRSLRGQMQRPPDNRLPAVRKGVTGANSMRVASAELGAQSVVSGRSRRVVHPTRGITATRVGPTL